MNAKDLRIVYMGTPDFAVAPLRTLVENGFNVVAVVTMPDKPSGRGLKLNESAVKQYAREAGLTILQPEKLRSEEFISELRSLNLDLGIVIAFRMLPEIVWSMPRFGTINLHASLLPQYRGAAPINWAIINGERTTGVTTFFLNHQIDCGDILTRREVTIDPMDNVGNLHDKLMNVGAKLVVDNVEMIAKGNVKPLPQITMEEGIVHDAPKIFKETCRINWSADSDTIHNLVRGLCPYPAAWSEMTLDGGEPITVKIFSTQSKSAQATVGYQPGDVVCIDGGIIEVVCGSGVLIISELQPAGKKRMSSADFLRGARNLDLTAFKFITLTKK